MSEKVYRLLNLKVQRKNKNKRHVFGFENLKLVAEKAGYGDLVRQHLPDCHPCWMGTLDGYGTDHLPFAIELYDDDTEAIVAREERDARKAS